VCLTYPILPFLYPSDVRLKRDIIALGRLDNGLTLYRYRYLWSEELFVGVMAQEVAELVPQAVTLMPEGYLAVDYAQLGLVHGAVSDAFHTALAIPAQLHTLADGAID
jgi:hypothetical protein